MNYESIQALANQIDLFFPESTRERALTTLAQLQEEAEEPEFALDTFGRHYVLFFDQRPPATTPTPTPTAPIA